MGNMFKNAYFNKPYKTNTGEKAIYLGEDLGDFKYKLAYQIISDISNKPTYIILECDEAGYSKTDIDIVSEWKEKINEEKLDKLAKSIYGNPRTKDSIDYGYIEGFKKGYREAKNH